MSQSSGRMRYYRYLILRVTRGADVIPGSFQAYTHGMLDIEEAKVKTKAEADKILQKVEPVGDSLPYAILPFNMR